MIFSENSTAKTPSSDQIASLQQWWASAGVDLDFVDQPHSLLEKVAETAIKPDKNPTVEAVSNVQEERTKFAAKQNFPENIDAFLQWLQNPENLIEKDWARELATPKGRLNPQYMIVSAIPESVNQGITTHFSKQSDELVRNMIKALGSDLEHCFHTPLALKRPIDGQIPDGFIQPLVDRLQHLIALVKPKQIVLFGDTLSQALFGIDLLAARKKKQFINHVSSKTEAIVTFHPRILLARPELKTEAWKDLQQLTRIGAQ